MKLKKIASLALAGIMAVSMLTACGSDTVDEKPPVDNGNDTTVTGYSATLQSKLSPHASASIKLSDDADLNKALNYAAGAVGYTAIVKEFYSDLVGNAGTVSYVKNNRECKALNEVRKNLNDALDVKIENKGDVFADDQILKLDPANKAEGDPAYYNKNDVNTVLLYVVDGSVSMENVMDEIAADIDSAIVALSEEYDSDSANGSGVTDSYFNYTGSVATYTKVYEGGHDMGVSLVAVEITRHIGK